MKKILIILFYIIYFLFLLMTILFELKTDTETYQHEEQQKLEVWQSQKNNIKSKNKYSLQEAKGSFQFNYNNEIYSLDELYNFIYTAANSGSKRVSFVNKYDNDYNYEEFNLNLVNHYLNTYYQLESIDWIYIPIFKKKHEYVELNRYYSDSDINYLEKNIENLYNKLYNPKLEIIDNIKKFHDYLIDNITYNESFDYANAKVALENQKACSKGYTDIMALLLDKMNIKNIKLFSERVEWNLVYINDGWYHLDVAWDDPDNIISNNNSRYKYFLIDDSTLSSYDSEFHNYDRNAYKFN